MPPYTGPLPRITRLPPDQSAPIGHPCDICLEDIDVRWGRIPAIWIPPDLNLVPVSRICSICESCMGDDGGIMTTISHNGQLVYRCASSSKWPGRLVIIAGGSSVQ